jgi:PIN domain nuclease of toxin-antitoxin system
LRLLLDTHALIWALGDSRRLGRLAREAIAADENEILVSPVSAMEVTTKHRLGKLDEVAELVRDFSGVLAAADYDVLPVTLDHAVLAGALDIEHRDPFDRLLIAQARIERVPLVSNEKLFDGFGVERLW